MKAWALFCCCLRHAKLSDSGGPDMEGEGSAVPSQPLSRTSSTRGSFRKVLPSVPDMEQQLSMSAKMIDRRTSTKKGSHSYTPYYFEYTLFAEYQLLQREKVSGVYVIPSADSPLVWFGVIFIRRGLYEGGIFRFSLFVPENYPDGDVPSVVFETPVFHPLVEPDTGELEVRKGFGNKWRRNVNHLWQVVLYLRRVFYKVETSHPLNPEAAVLYDSDQDMFESRVQDCVSASQEAVFTPPRNADPHAFIFSPYDPKIHDDVRRELKSADKEYLQPEDSCKGMSWIQPGTMNIFSKEAL